MNAENTRWWKQQSRRVGRLKTPADLAQAPISSRDYVDSAVLGGIELKDLAAGRLAERDIPAAVLRAYHEQYPDAPRNLLQEVHKLHGNPERLRGLAEGIKGKMFEDQYVDWLNHGHLPTGAHAELARSATNPAWDIRIIDAHGHVIQDLQLKATDNMHVIEHALQRYPAVDVVTTHEVFRHVAQHPELAGHVLESAVSNQGLDHTARHAVGQLSVHDPLAFHVPLLSVAVIAALELAHYRGGAQSLQMALKHAGSRSFLSLVCAGVAWISVIISGEPFVGLPTSIATRLATGWGSNELEERNALHRSIELVRSSRRALAGNSDHVPACRG